MACSGGAAVFSAEPDSHRPVCGRFDLRRLDGTRLVVGWAPHDEHARLMGDYRARNQKMPLAVVLGGDPAFLLAAAAPLPPDADVCAVAGLLRGKPLDVVACRGVDLTVPADASLDVDLKTENGRTDSDFELNRRESDSGDRMSGRLRNGGATLRVNTAEGDIVLRKRQTL